MPSPLPLRIATLADLDRANARSKDEASDELLGAAEGIRFAVLNGALQLPVTLTFPNPPDIEVISDAGQRLSIEVTRLGWERLSQVWASAGPGYGVEINPDLWVNRRARHDPSAPKGSRSGDYRAIKKKGEPLDGDGWTGDELRESAVAALNEAVTRKNNRLGTYVANTGRSWLFLLNNFSGDWDEILSNPILCYKTQEICSKSGFERVLLFCWERGVTSLFKQAAPNRAEETT